MSAPLCSHDLYRKYAERWESMRALTDDTEFLRQYEAMIREEPTLRHCSWLDDDHELVVRVLRRLTSGDEKPKVSS